MTPGMCSVTMSPLSFQSWMAKDWMPMCRDLSVGCLALAILLVEALSSCSLVGPSGGNPSSCSMVRRYLATLAAVQAAQSSASVDEVAVIPWAVDPTNDPLLCLCRAIARCILHLQRHGISNVDCLHTYYNNSHQKRNLSASALTTSLRICAATVEHQTGIPADSI